METSLAKTSQRQRTFERLLGPVTQIDKKVAQRLQLSRSHTAATVAVLSVDSRIESGEFGLDARENDVTETDDVS